MLLEDLVERVFYTQERVGRGGETFTLYKFRTMEEGPEESYEEWEEIVSWIQSGEIEHHPRVTRVGGYLRRWNVDEWPQVYNILKREMRIFGARPLQPDFFQELPEDLQEKRKEYKPGLLCPDYADQVTDWGEKIECERRYFKRFDENPHLTNLIYFVRGAYNFVFRGYRGFGVRNNR